MAAKPIYEELERRIQELEKQAAIQKGVEEELRRNEVRFRRFFDNDLTGDFITDGDGTILEVNPAFLKMFGYEDKAEILNRNIVLLYPAPSERAFVLSELTAKGKLEHYQTVRKRKDGTLITVDENIVATLDENGKLAEVKGFICDVTERRQAQRAFRRTEERLRRIYDSGMIGIIYWTMDGRITDANDKFLDLVGYTREDLKMGRIHWGEMTPSEYRRADEHALAELASKGVDTPYEKEYIRKDGSRVPISIGVVMLGDPPDEGVTLVLDISDRKKVEQKAVFEEVFRSAPTFLHVLRGPDFVFEFANEAYYQLVGRRDLIGRPAFEAMPEAVEGGYPERIARVMATGEPFFGRELPVTLARKPDGPPRSEADRSRLHSSL